MKNILLGFYSPLSVIKITKKPFMSRTVKMNIRFVISLVPKI